jgi:membrane protein implicated in regulation of membrane protease activity
MANKAFARAILLYIIEVCTVVLVFAAVNLFILPHSIYFRAYDWFFFEGIFCFILSVLFALGRRGIDAYTSRSATAKALADAIYGKDYEVSETFRKDKWRPEGFPKAALVLLIAGIVILMIYFLTLK